MKKEWGITITYAFLFLGADVDVHESTASNNCVNHRGGK